MKHIESAVQDDSIITNQSKDYVCNSCHPCMACVCSFSYNYVANTLCVVYVYITKQKHPGCKTVRGQSEAALQIGSYVRPKTLISVVAKKLLIKNLFHYLNDIQ